MQIGTWIILGILILLVVPLFGIPLIVFQILLVRTNPEKWGRDCSMPEDKPYLQMHEEGRQWAEKHAEQKKEVSVRSDGLKLCGEYFDFGNKKAVIIIPGRMESCIYSYYFAEPFRQAGCNVLVIDNRAHGLSEGKYNCLGFKEYRDILAWSRLLHEEFGIEGIVLHGICIGSETSLFTITAKKCPEYVKGMIGEGMYVNFYESLKNHMIEQKRPMYPFIYIIVFWIWAFTGAHIMTDGPLKRIRGLKKPILFLHSREDIYSFPELAVKLYDACPSQKEIVWFETGDHSRIRTVHKEKYDRAIAGFVNRIF